MNENEILSRFYELNSLPKEFSYKRRVRNTKFNEYLFPTWMTGEPNDLWLRGNSISLKLKELGLTAQLYYDIMELRINDIDKRPKCLNDKCNNTCKFYNMSRGYGITCCRSCAARVADLDPIKNSKLLSTFCISRRGMSNTLDHRNKCSKKLKGRVISDETRRKTSRTMLKKYEDPNEILKRLIIKSSSRTRKGWISISKCKEDIYYGSSWEKHLIELCENSNEVKEVYRCKVIPYKFNDESKRYLPDLLVELINGNFILFEVKPSSELNLPRVLAKANAGRIWCNERGYEYRFFTEKDMKLKNNYKFIN